MRLLAQDERAQGFPGVNAVSLIEPLLELAGPKELKVLTSLVGNLYLTGVCRRTPGSL